MKDEVRIAKAEKLNKTMLSVPKEDRTAEQFTKTYHHH